MKCEILKCESVAPALTPSPLPSFCTIGLCDVRNDQTCRNCWARLDGDLACEFVVRMNSPMKPAVSFHGNAVFQRTFCVMPDPEATRFSSVVEARNRMREYGLPETQATIHRIPKT